MTSCSIGIATYNCNGLANFSKRNEIFTWLQDKENVKIFCLQETHSQPENESQWRSEWNGPIHFCHGLSNRRGVMILIKKEVQHTVHSVLTDKVGRWIMLDLTVDSLRINIMNIYAPNEDNPCFFEEIHNVLSAQENNQNIIVGDYNTVLDVSKDRTGMHTFNYHPQALIEIKELIASLDLVDIWRFQNPDSIRYSWRRGQQASRIDYFLISFSLLPMVSKCNIGDRFRSDHVIITLQVTTAKYPCGRGYWKFNQSCLKDPIFVEKTKEFIEYFFEVNENSSNPHNVWEAFKCAFRGHAIKIGSWKQKMYLMREKTLIGEINELNSKLDEIQQPSSEMICLVKEKQLELENLYSERVNGIINRARANWMEKGEKCTAHFLRLNRSNAVKKNIMKLYTTEGVSLMAPQDILREEVDYFRTIFSLEKEPEPLGGQNVNIFFPHACDYALSVHQQQSCEGAISEEELLDAINSFSSGKSPGIDGIPIEFYKVFFEEIKKPLLESFNFSYNLGFLSETQKEGIITLLLKQDSQGNYKDPGYLKNWRPLTLLCVDTRILSKCIALRIKRIIDQIIKYDQTGFIKGRFIGDNIRHLLDTIECYDQEKKPGLLFIADFEKAFDKVRWDFIQKTLCFFNFGVSLVKWVKVLYNSPTSRIINNGHVSNPFTLARGVRQGCPLSPYLFLFSIEILANRIRNNHCIVGLKPYDLEAKITLYADDAIFFLHPEKSSLHALIEDLKLFARLSGLEPNFEKCTIMRIGTLRGTDFSLQCPAPVKWSNGAIDVLGIHIPENPKDLVKINYERKIEKIEKVLQPWRGNILSLQGRVILINTLVIPQFIYLIMTLPSPEASLFKFIEQKMFKFLWNNKPDKIKRQYVYNSYENGGLNLKNIVAMDLALKASWVNKIYHNTHWRTSQTLATVYTFFECKLFPFFQLMPQHVDWLLKEPLGNLSPFFKDAVKAWLSFQYYPPNSLNEIQYQIIWMNSSLLINGKPFLWKHFQSKGIIFINDLLDNAGNFLSYEQFNKKYGQLCDSYNFNQLLSTVPLNWRRKLKNSSNNQQVSAPVQKTLKWLTKIKINKMMYNFFLFSRCLSLFPHAACSFWEDEFNTLIPWKDYFRSFYTRTIDSYSRIFQIKIFYRITATNKQLNIFNINHSPLCKFCNEEVEDQLHLFFYCTHVVRFWLDIQKWLRPKNIHFEFTPLNILLGVLEINCPQIVNTIILLGKIFIFKTQTKTLLNLAFFRNKVRCQFLLEKIIASNQDKIEMHNKKWGKLTFE